MKCNYKSITENRSNAIQKQVEFPFLDFTTENNRASILNPDIFFNELKRKMQSGNDTEIIEGIEQVRSVKLIDFISQDLFITFKFPSILMSIFNYKSIPSSTLSNLLIIILEILSSPLKPLECSVEFVKSGIIPLVFNELISTKSDKVKIISILQALSFVAEESIFGRNSIFRINGWNTISSLCFSDDTQISQAAYFLVRKLCNYGLSINFCKVILNLYIKGIQSGHVHAYDLIFEGLFQVSFVQETYWFSILLESEGESILAYFINSHEAKYVVHCLQLFQRAVETKNLLPDIVIGNILSLVSTGLDVHEPLSALIRLCIKNEWQIDSFLNNGALQALILIAENGSYLAKDNSVFCISKLTIREDLGLILQVISGKKLIELMAPLLCSSNQESILYVLISFHRLFNYSIANNTVNSFIDDFTEHGLFEIVDSLQFHDDSLIQEKSHALLQNIIQQQSDSIN